MAGCDPNEVKGKQFIVLLRDDADTEWQIIGGATSRSFEISNPTQVVTSQSTQGDFGESRSTGYSQVTISIDGVHDLRQGAHAESGYNFAPSGRLLALAKTGERCGKFLMLNLQTSGMLEGCMTIASYSKSGEQEGIVSYSMSLESREGVTITGDL